MCAQTQVILSNINNFCLERLKSQKRKLPWHLIHYKNKAECSVRAAVFGHKHCEQIAVHMLLIELCRAPVAHCLQSQTELPCLSFSIVIRRPSSSLPYGKKKKKKHAENAGKLTSWAIAVIETDHSFDDGQAEIGHKDGGGGAEMIFISVPVEHTRDGHYMIRYQSNHSVISAACY